MAGEQNFKVFLSFKDEATGKFIKATEDQIASMKKLGLTIKKEGSAAAVDIDKMGQKMDETGRHSRYLGVEISALAGKIGTIRNMILVWMFALRPLISTIRESVEAAKEQEDSERRLAAAFAATGVGSRAGANAIIEQASALQALTGASDNEIISSGAILATFRLNEQQIQRLLPLLVDMSRLVRSRSGEEMSLASIAKAVGQAFSSNASRLQYLGITLDETTKKSKDFNSIIGAIEKSVGGAAQAMAGTFTGQMNIWKAAMSDFHESIGNIITRSPYFLSIIRLMTESINQHNKSLKDSQERTDNFAEAWRRILAALIGVWTIFKGLVDVILQVGRAIDMIIMAILGFASRVTLAIIAIITALVSIIPFSKKVQDSLITLGDQVERWQFTFQGANKEMMADFNKTNATLGNMGNSAVDLYAKILEGANNISAQMKIDVKGLIADLDELQNEAGNKLNSMVEITSSAVTGMRDALRDGFFKVVKDDFESLGDVVISFGDMMIKKILEVAATWAMIKALPWTAGILGFAGGIAHTGGYIYSGIESSFGFRKKFHSGGEVPATLLEGEGVLNKTGMRSLGVDNLNKLNRGEEVGTGQTINNYYIQTIDERSFRERLMQNGDIYASASDSAIRNNSGLRHTSQRWG
jgi:PAS domain-containing protein